MKSLGRKENNCFEEELKTKATELERFKIRSISYILLDLVSIETLIQKRLKIVYYEGIFSH